MEAPGRGNEEGSSGFLLESEIRHGCGNLDGL